MKETEGLTITVGMNTDKLQLKLRAIAKHAETLANELDAIDNEWECPNCGASYYSDVYADDELEFRICKECNHAYSGQYITSDELPIRPEGSE